MGKRVLIADDDGLVRDGLRMLLELEDDFDAVEVCDTGRLAVDLAVTDPPDIILMDIRMPELDGVQATQSIREAGLDCAVLILTTFQDDEYIRDCLAAGASGYILKNRPSEQIIESVRSVLRGMTVFDSQVAEKVSGMVGGGQRRSREELGISEREYEVLALVGEGRSNREIAEALFISEGTVRNYVSELLEKLDLRDRTQLALAFHRCLR